MKKICRHFFISGKVQGVFYRQNAKQQAQQLNLTGWVKNLDDGRVELVACGEEQNLKALLAWLPEGPKKAVVENVQNIEHPYEEFDTFEVFK